MFPSQRFSRSQGFAPSGPLWAFSIPLTLLGFRPEGPEDRRDTPRGVALQEVLPPSCLATRRTQALRSAQWIVLPKGSDPAYGWAKPKRAAYNDLGAPAGQSSPDPDSLHDGRNHSPCRSRPGRAPVARHLPRPARACGNPKVPLGPGRLAGPGKRPDPEGPVCFPEVPDLSCPSPLRGALHTAHRRVSGRSEPPPEGTPNCSCSLATRTGLQGGQRPDKRTIFVGPGTQRPGAVPAEANPYRDVLRTAPGSKPQGPATRRTEPEGSRSFRLVETAFSRLHEPGGGKPPPEVRQTDAEPTRRPEPQGPNPRDRSLPLPIGYTATVALPARANLHRDTLRAARGCRLREPATSRTRPSSAAASFGRAPGTGLAPPEASLRKGVSRAAHADGPQGSARARTRPNEAAVCFLRVRHRARHSSERSKPLPESHRTPQDLGPEGHRS
jgi:hypothetical protein